MGLRFQGPVSVLRGDRPVLSREPGAGPEYAAATNEGTLLCGALGSRKLSEKRTFFSVLIQKAPRKARARKS